MGRAPVTAWGNGIAKPWHKRVQPSRLIRFAEGEGLRAERAGESRPPRGRSLAHTIEIRTTGVDLVATAWFREGSFIAGKFGEEPGYRVGTGITPHRALENFIHRIARSLPESGGSTS